MGRHGHAEARDVGPVYSFAYDKLPKTGVHHSGASPTHRMESFRPVPMAAAIRTNRMQNREIFNGLLSFTEPHPVELYTSFTCEH